MATQTTQAILIKRTQMVYALYKMVTLIQKRVIDGVLITFFQTVGEHYSNCRIVGVLSGIPKLEFIITAYWDSDTLPPEPSYILLDSETKIFDLINLCESQDSEISISVTDGNASIGNTQLLGYIKARLELLFAQMQIVNTDLGVMDFAQFFSACDSLSIAVSAFGYKDVAGITDGRITMLLPTTFLCAFWLETGTIAETLDTADSQIYVMGNSQYAILQFDNVGDCYACLRFYCPRIYNFNPSLLARIRQMIAANMELGLNTKQLEIC